eukprot:jgi/Phyca11/43677/gw1.62.46.1
MTNMKGLKRIQQMIFFFSWKRQAVQRRLHRVRERLVCSLFTCHPVAAQLLMDVRDACIEIEREAEREYVEADTSYTLNRLAHIHWERVCTAKATISQKIYELCRTINDATQDISRYKEVQNCSYAITDHELFSRTLRLSSLRERMFAFLRLVDCHVAEAVYQYVTLVVWDLQVRICGESKGLYVSLRDDVDFEGDVNSATMHFVPAKVEVLELIHTILMEYCVAMDGLPRILMDKHFQHVLTPFVPSFRRDFNDSLLKPSHLALESFEPELREMRAAVDLHFRRIGILQQEHLRCVRSIRVAERESPSNEADEDDGRLPELPDLSSSAAAYELAQKTWNRFVQYANNAAPMLQVGYLLLDQRSFVDRLRGHVSKRVAEMADALPVIYQQVLTSLLDDVDGRTEKITKIPTNLTEANKWLAQVTSMMPTHPFRQRLDAKIANLAHLRVLMKERGLMSLEPDVQDAIRKLELTWESVIETLLMCLARVEERDSEHRRSIQDAITKVDEHITSQLQSIIKTFEELPTGTQEDLVQRLEDLVEMDIERKNVVLQFEEYDREHRAILDMPPVQHAVWTSSHSRGSSESLSAVSLTDKLTSELLLLYIITSLELRQWYESWKKLQDKWLGSPLNGVHPGTMINRIKQFRRRLGHASSRLSRLSSALKDLKLMKVFDFSIEEMLNCNRIFQAITGGAFSDARWAAMNQLLNGHSGTAGGNFTLREMKEACGADQFEAFLEVCDECIVEAKLHVKLEQARQRLARIEVRVEETNYSVRCERVPEALALLDDIAVDLKLCLFGQNPELQLCLELRAELERKTAVCEHILTYQKHWRLRCEATKLHEVDEFFSKRFSGCDDFVPRARKAQHKTGLKQEQSVWQSFLDASHAWSDRLRRLFFVSPHQAQMEQLKGNSRSLLGRNSAVTTGTPLTVIRRLSTATKSMDCTLDDVMEIFKDFDFEATFAACERGMKLVQSYLESLREKTPRLYCLDETTMLGLLLRDSDMKQLHQALSICFPRVHRFSISRAASRIGSTIEAFGNPESVAVAPVRSKTDGTITILGLEGQGNTYSVEKSGRFRLAVAKIGRVKFWFTRLEEEMALMVLTDLKQAFEWVTQDWESSAADYLLPQSIATALGLRFTFEMNCALQKALNQLYPLRDSLRRKLVHLVATRRAEKPSSCLRPGKHGKVERSELFPVGADFLKDSASSHVGQSTNMVVSCQVAHLQMPLGQEFIGWGRPALLSPFTQRCSYAIFCAMRMHHTALVVPFSSSGNGTNLTSLLWGISEMLMRPCIEFSCDPNAGTTSSHKLGQVMNATTKLNGLLIVRHLLQLSAALVGVVREYMLHHFHQAAPAGTNSVVLPHYSGNLSYGVSALFIPLESKDELHRSGLVQSIRTQFRAVAVTRPAIKYVVESALLADGFMTEQIRGLNVVEAFEAIEREVGSCAFNTEFLVYRVCEEVRRLRAQYRVVGKLVTKSKGEEEAVAAAVTIYLKSVYALPRDCEQFELILELWRALQTFPAALVYGAPGSGKTTCITALHRALVALELSERSQENEQMGRTNTSACGAEVSGSLKWVLVDGEIDGAVLDRLLDGDRRVCSSTSALPSSSTLFRGLSGSIMSADSSDSRNTRLLVEVTNLESLSPSALRKCWNLHVPARCITAASIVNGWRAKWETQLAFEPDSRGFEAMTAVFKTVDALLLRICVRFVVDESTSAQKDGEVSTAGLKLGFLSLNHATQTALTMVSLCCLNNKLLLQELPYLRLMELVAFAVVSGFSCHLVGSVRLKLENYVRAKSKEFSETRHLAELPRNLVDAGHFEDVWDELAFDSSSGQFLVLVPAAASLMRICTLFLHSSHSFLLVGPTASGKTSLLRWLMLRNRESEAEEMKVETSLDERRVHGILDWTHVPAAWFRPTKQRECGISSRAKMREDSELFAGRSRHSFVFLDDLDA